MDFLSAITSFIERYSGVLNLNEETVLGIIDQVQDSQPNEDEISEDAIYTYSQLAIALHQWIFDLDNLTSGEDQHPLEDFFGPNSNNEEDQPMEDGFAVRNLNNDFEAASNPAQLGVEYSIDEFLNLDLPTQELTLFENEEENCDFTGEGGRKVYPVRVSPTNRIYCALELKRYLTTNRTDPFDRRPITSVMYLTSQMIANESNTDSESNVGRPVQSEIPQSRMLDIMRRQLSAAEEDLRQAQLNLPAAQQRTNDTGDERYIYWARQAVIGAEDRVQTLRRMVRQQEQAESQRAERVTNTQTPKTLHIKITPYKLKF